MLDRGREQDPERRGERHRPRQPDHALQFGTLGWASAVGNGAVARIARQAAEEDPALEPPAGGPGAEAEPEGALEAPAADAGAEPGPGGAQPELEAQGGIPDDLPEELPA